MELTIKRDHEPVNHSGWGCALQPRQRSLHRNLEKRQETSNKLLASPSADRLAFSQRWRPRYLHDTRDSEEEVPWPMPTRESGALVPAHTTFGPTQTGMASPPNGRL